MCSNKGNFAVPIHSSISLNGDISGFFYFSAFIGCSGNWALIPPSRSNALYGGRVFGSWWLVDLSTMWLHA